MSKNKKITITFSQTDIEDLLDGSTFDWTFDEVDVHICRGECCDMCGDEVETLLDSKDGQSLCEHCLEEITD